MKNGKWFLSEKCKDCYYRRSLCSTHFESYADGWDGKICYYLFDTGNTRGEPASKCSKAVSQEDYVARNKDTVYKTIAQMRKSGATVSRIGNATHLSSDLVKDILNELGFPVKAETGGDSEAHNNVSL